MARGEVYDHLFNFVLLGDSTVGKSLMRFRFTKDSFYLPTIGIDFSTKRINLQGKNIETKICDTSGDETYQVHIPSYLTQCQGIMVVYDITNQSSFDNLPHWLGMSQHSPDAEVLLVGNKSDLDSERVISKERGQQLASSLGISFRETSAKEGIKSVAEAFHVLARAALLKLYNPKDFQLQYPATEEEDLKGKEADRCSTM